MWQVDNRTPFAAERGWVRDRNGAEVWLVAVKCTFDIKPDGSTEVSSVQPPVLLVPEYYGEPGKSSMRYDTDLVLTKKTTDVILNGHAYAPKNKPVTKLDVEMRVGPVTKKLCAYGDRAWGTFGANSPQLFGKMPLVYERAFGGVDHKSAHPERDWEWRNPVGTGFAASQFHLSGIQLPNIEYPNKLFSGSSTLPAGFGPICSHWQPRAGFAGTYDDQWMKTRQPLLPEDFDDRYFQCAPVDQQPPVFLRGDEPVALMNLTPQGNLNFNLPRVILGFETRFYDGSRELHKTRNLHTVIIEPDFPRVSLVWHSALSCHFKVQKLERTIVTMKRLLRNGEQSAEESAMELA